MAWQNELAVATATRPASQEEQRRLVTLLGLSGSPLPLPQLWARALDQLGVGRSSQALIERKVQFVHGTGYPMEYAWLRLGTSALAYSNTVAAAGITGAPYSSGSAATGGKSPYSYAVTSGALPDGLALSATSGVVSGTPTLAGAYPYTIRVTDALGTQKSISGTITITDPV